MNLDFICSSPSGGPLVHSIRVMKRGHEASTSNWDHVCQRVKQNVFAYIRYVQSMPMMF